MSSYKDMENEELVFLIQENPDDQEAWDELWKKTKDTIYYVYHERVHAYYKETMNDDLLAVLNIGWYQAVKTYKKDKATGPFHCFAIFIIDQRYRQMLRKYKPERIGKSVRTEFLQDIKMSSVSSDSTTDSIDFCVSNILEDKDSSFDFNQIELKDYIDSKMELLKEYYPDSYKYITEIIYNGKTQTSISKEYKVSKAKVSKAVKKGYEYLRYQCEQDKFEDGII